MNRALGTVLLALTVAPLLAGCAATAPAESPRDSTRAASARPAPTPRVSVVPADSLPSEDALNVLKSIPEPLAPGEVVPPAESGAPANPADTTGVGADSASTVPTPSVTSPLGERPGTSAQSSLADSLARAAALVPAARSAPGAAPPAAGGGGARAASGLAGAGAIAAGAGSASAMMRSVAGNDTCWRVQVAAPTDSAEAEEMRAAAESQLLVPMTVALDGYRYKVQCRDCMTELSSMALRMRAVAAGFDGAFRTRTVETPPAAPPAAPPASAKKPAAKKAGSP